MLAAYQSGDPYLAFAKLAGAVPADATKKSHPEERELYKACALAVQYGMGFESLANRIQQINLVARNLLRAHREAFPDFWKWSEAAVDTAMLHGAIQTVMGWPIRIFSEEAMLSEQAFRKKKKPDRMLANFPMQANGAEMLRLACIFATEAGIEVCAPVHDALLIMAPLSRLDEEIDRAKACMTRASKIILSDFELGVDAKVAAWPDRYMDERGVKMWETIVGLLPPEAPITERQVA